MAEPAPTPAGFSQVSVPARIADLAFSFIMPDDWRALDVPPESPDFDKPAFLFPLHACMATYGMIVFTVAARPAYGDGAVDQWLGYLCAEQGIRLESVASGTINGLPAILAEATQTQEAGPLRLRLALMEDGARMVLLMGLAPQAMWATAGPIMERMIGSFRLDHPKGATAPLTADASPAGTAPSHAAPADAPAPEAPFTRPADVALADDAASLDPDHPMNARLRDAGAGLVPRVHEFAPTDRYAVVAAGAIVALFRVPFGWHVIDDGRRTLVFDAAGKIQINLDLRVTGGLDDDALIKQKINELAPEQPGLEWMRTRLMDQATLGLRGLVIDGDRLEQAYLFRRGTPHADRVLVTRVTAAPEDMPRALNLAEVLHRHLTFPAS